MPSFPKPSSKSKPRGSRREEPRAQLASNPSTPAEILARLSFDPSRLVLQCVAHAAALPGPFRELLGRHPWGFDVSVDADKPLDAYRTRDGNFVYSPLDATAADVQLVYRHPSFPEPLLAVHMDEHYGTAGLSMAGYPWPSPELWEQLSRHDSSHTRAELARRADVPLDILLRLAADEHTRYVAFKNPLLPAELWDTLSREKKMGGVLAGHPKASVKDLKRLAKDKDKYVRRSVLMNPSAPLDLVAKLARDKEGDVRKWAALVPNLPAESLQALLQDEYPEARAWAEWRRDSDAMKPRGI